MALKNAAKCTESIVARILSTDKAKIKADQEFNFFDSAFLLIGRHDVDFCVNVDYHLERKNKRFNLSGGFHVGGEGDLNIDLDITLHDGLLDLNNLLLKLDLINLVRHEIEHCMQNCLEGYWDIYDFSNVTAVDDYYTLRSEIPAYVQGFCLESKNVNVAYKKMKKFCRKKKIMRCFPQWKNFAESNKDKLFFVDSLTLKL